jgi:hypothetical protein
MRQVTIYTTDAEYQNFLTLVKRLSYVQKIETDEDSTTSLDNFQLSEEQKKLLDLAVSQNKDTFISRAELSKRYGL